MNVLLFGRGERLSEEPEIEKADQNYFRAAVIQVLPSIKAHMLRVHEELFSGL